jgi:thioredoxin reductase (NADPH)
MKKNEVAIIGMGPAGVSAAIYLKRFGMIPFCFEKELVGGKVNKTEKIENYAGILSINGPDLGMSFEKQLDSFSIEPIYKEVKSITLNEDGSFHLVYGKNITHDFRYVILANGLGEKPFGIPGEEKFHRRGISRCAICDGPLYKGKNVAVIGGGNAAFEEATYLSGLAEHVYLIARRKEYRAQEEVVRKFLLQENVDLLSPYEVISCDGETSLQSLTVKNKETDEERNLQVDGLFLYVGEVPQTDFVEIPSLVDENGHFVTDENRMTKAKNLFAIGDCRKTSLRQVAVAVSDGAIAANKIHEDYQNS